MRRKIITKTPRETRKLADLILRNLFSRKTNDKINVIAFSGELGAGKTTLIQGLGTRLGIKEKIKSPTFVLMRTYALPRRSKAPWKNMVHIDAYRFETRKEIQALGLKDILKNRQNLVVIEWPEKIGRLLPRETLWVEFHHRGKQHRHVFISAPPREVFHPAGKI